MLSQTVQDAVSDIMKNELPDLLQHVFDELSTEDEIIRIDAVQLNVGSVSIQDIQQSFAGKIAQQIKEAIIQKRQESDNENGVVVIRKQQSLREGFLYFLQTGLKPWFDTKKSKEHWESQIQKGFQQQDWQKILIWLQEKYSSQPVVIERLANQFSDAFLKQLSNALFPLKTDKWEEVYEDLVTLNETEEARNERKTKSDIWLLCFRSFLVEPREENALYSVIKALFLSKTDNRNSLNKQQEKTTEKKIKTQIVRNAIEKKASSDEVWTTKKNIDDNESSIALSLNKSNTGHLQKPAIIGAIIPIKTEYVINSGVVLLHPFLEMYFDELLLLKERDFINLDARKKAVLLLHYLSTGETEMAEYDLLLQKIICGLPLEETLPNNMELTEEESEESEKLLQSVINHWAPLKNTSSEGLRSTFLQREGKVEKKENGWLLTVESKTVDILLDKLPWGFSTLRLPWMKDMISVDWC